MRQELYEFCRLLFDKGLTGGTILEIGLGRRGGTHRVWRSLFSRVVTIECSMTRVERVAAEFTDGRSEFVCRSSAHPATLAKVKEKVSRVDVLFIDGDHRYNGVRHDWEMYHDLVRPGGLVAWHDCETTVNDNYGVHEFLRELAHGHVDGKQHDIQRIVRSKQIGIAYEVC